MANHQSAFKRMRIAERRRVINRKSRKRLTTMIKRLRTTASREEAQKLLPETVALLDQSASKGLIHANKAANQKSKLTQFVNKMA
jgi:small subunit ribosomal protein S20